MRQQSGLSVIWWVKTENGCWPMDADTRVNERIPQPWMLVNITICWARRNKHTRLHILIAGQAFLLQQFYWIYSTMASRAPHCALQRHKWVNLLCHLSSFLSALWNSMGGNGWAKRGASSYRGFRLCVWEKEEAVHGDQLWRTWLLFLNHSVCVLLFHVSWPGRSGWSWGINALVHTSRTWKEAFASMLCSLPCSWIQRSHN